MFFRILACSPEQRLYVAIAEGNKEKIERLIDDDGASMTMHDGLTALHVACEIGKLPAVEALIQRGANVNEQVRKACCLNIIYWAYIGRTESTCTDSSCVPVARYRSAQLFGGEWGSGRLEGFSRKSACDPSQKGLDLLLSSFFFQTPFELARTNAARKLLVQARTVYVHRPSDAAAATAATAASDSTDGSKRFDKGAPRHDVGDSLSYDLQRALITCIPYIQVFFLRRCRICMDNTVNTIILPCGHQVRGFPLGGDWRVISLSLFC